MWPLSGRDKPAMQEISVVLLAPFGPSRAKNSPASTDSETWSSAVQRAKALADRLNIERNGHWRGGKKGEFTGKSARCVSGITRRADDSIAPN